MSKKLPAIMFDELVSLRTRPGAVQWHSALIVQAITSAMYARNVTAIDQSWLVEIPFFGRLGGAMANGH